MAKEKTEAFETFNLHLEPIRGFPELRWMGKRPFTSTQYFPAQLKEEYGHSVEGWWNKLFWGDNLQVMSHLLREFRGKIDLIYIDPPFDSKADYRRRISLKGGNAESDRNSFEEIQYTDLWESGNYLQFIYDRCVLIKELLSDRGVFVFHCDQKKNYQLRQVAEEIFTPGWFRNEIIWHYENKLGTGGNILDNNHDTLLVFSPVAQWMRRVLKVDVKKVKPQPVTQKVDGKRIWLRDEEGNRIYKESEAQRKITDVWTIPIINPVASERLGYPTQKPERLLEQIILSATDAGDVVFDCFMGSGTTQAVAMKLGRRFIGADINLGAIETTIERLNGIRGSIERQAPRLTLDGGDQPSRLYSGIQLFNVNDYDLFRNPVEAKQLISEAMELHPLAQNIAFDGEKDGFLVKIMPVNRIATRQDLNEIITNLDFRAFEKRRDEYPTKPVEKIMLVCMGHEPDLGEHLKMQAKPFEIEVQVVDILRDKSHLHFKRAASGKLSIEKGDLVISGFYPMNLLQKLSVEEIDDWRQLVETVKIDWNFDGAVLSPAVIDNPEEGELVKGRYTIPNEAGTIRVKITDLLSESWEASIANV